MAHTPCKQCTIVTALAEHAKALAEKGDTAEADRVFRLTNEVGIIHAKRLADEGGEAAATVIVLAWQSTLTEEQVVNSDELKGAKQHQEESIALLEQYLIEKGVIDE